MTSLIDLLFSSRFFLLEDSKLDEVIELTEIREKLFEAIKESEYSPTKNVIATICNIGENVHKKTLTLPITLIYDILSVLWSIENLKHGYQLVIKANCPKAEIILL